MVHDEAGDFAESRDVVDLLWFPTGGGKTEAYLAVAAWELFYRRLEDGLKGAGTAVIKRYTLRLLTSQQFQRAGTLICAMEDMRRELQKEMGGQPFTLGLWVGQDSAPNKFTSGDRDKPAALEKYLNLREEGKPENPFQLQRCPWCGTSIVPKEKRMIKVIMELGLRKQALHFTALQIAAVLIIIYQSRLLTKGYIKRRQVC